MANRLARERSPYLRQHADNPVHWYPWGDEAFEAARREDKPIFLSIGYSTCHWCHVMAHESFEDPAIADVLNRDFISIKLDREERPDVDRVYMMFVQATTGAGGWPMSVWLTPDREPFYGGTYFPPTSRWGRPGFIEVLGELARAWRDERPRVRQSATELVLRLKEASGEGAPGQSAPVAGPEAIDAGVATFAQSFDRRHGGFGGAPKFPRPSELHFLFQAYAFRGDRRARDMALSTLHAMAMGGMRDQIGGGFHRYSVDAEWRVPHFEKMLYDQAQLALAYLDAAQVSGEEFYASIAEDTLAYVVRDLTAPSGAFYSAEDADSESHESHENHERHEKHESHESHESHGTHGTHGRHGTNGSHGTDGSHGGKKEGAFYVWTAAEIDRLLDDDALVFRRRFGVEDGGNALADPQGEFTGQNILYVAQSLEDVAARSDRTVDEVMAALGRAREVLFEVRERRPRPHLDDKVIAAWNGLMIAAFARAARVLVTSPHRDAWRTAAVRAAAALEDTLRQPGGRLYRTERHGSAGIDGFNEDYACVAYGLLELFEATGDVRWLDWSRELTATQRELFFDDRDGGWFSTTGDDPSVLLRLKEDYDGAEPAAASITVRNLLRLSQLTGDSGLRALAQRTLERYGPQIGRVVRVMPFMVSNVALWHAPKMEIVLAGSPDAADTRALERVIARQFLPWAVVVPVAPGDAQAALAKTLPWIASMSPRAGAAAYVCEGFACQAPTSDPEALARQLETKAEPSRIIRP
jgi:uncharacterized protein YyaL (SSP411 family)